MSYLRVGSARSNWSLQIETKLPHTKVMITYETEFGVHFID